MKFRKRGQVEESKEGGGKERKRNQRWKKSVNEGRKIQGENGRTRRERSKLGRWREETNPRKKEE